MVHVDTNHNKMYEAFHGMPWPLQQPHKKGTHHCPLYCLSWFFEAGFLCVALPVLKSVKQSGLQLKSSTSHVIKGELRPPNIVTADGPERENVTEATSGHVTKG